MKTLSVRQPWAELIMQGRKTLELRSWMVRYRGPLAIHASRTVERADCLDFGLDPDRLTTGAVVGIVDLAGIDELDRRSFRAPRRTPGGWRSVRIAAVRLAPGKPPAARAASARGGRVGLFEVPDRGASRGRRGAGRAGSCAALPQ